MSQFSYFGHILAIIGGILMVIFSLLAMISYAVVLPFQSPITGFFGADIITLILGIIAVVLLVRA
jgi:uncharacterized membrane protein